MLRLLFTTQDKSKQLTVITDGIDSQLNVFVTENTVGDIDYFKSLGIMILPGHVYNIGTLKGWAFNNALILISYPEGLNEEAQILIDVTEEIRYTFTAKTTKLSFPNTGGDEEAVVTSYKQKYINGKPSGSQTALEVTFETTLPYSVSKGDTVTISETTSPYSVSKGGTVTISENPTNQVRNGNLKITQKESNKILNISLTQAASKVSYNYSFTVNPKELTFVNTGELKTVDVTHTKQKLVNDKPSGSPIKVAFDVEIAGVGFSYDIIDSGVNVTVSENPGTSKRTGTITISSQESEDSTTINLSQNASVITYDYTITTNPTSLSFVNTGGTKTFSVSAKKQKKINGKNSGNPTDVGFSFVVNGAGFSKGSGNNVVAVENTTESQRTGSAVITQNESNKTATINLSQAAGAVTYEYTLDANPDTLNFTAAGETKTFSVSAKKQKKINGKNSGAASAVNYTTAVSGDGFTKGTTEHSVVAAANSTTNQRTGQAVVTMSEGNKKVTVTLTQEANASAQ
jgi:hypothetical protein